MPATFSKLKDGTFSVSPPDGLGKTHWVYSKDDAQKLAAALDEKHSIDAETAKILKVRNKLLVWLPKLGRCVMAKSEAHANVLLAEGEVFDGHPEHFDPERYSVEEPEPTPEVDDDSPKP